MKKIVIDPGHIDSSLIKEAAQTIFQGGIVAFPTETVYGLAVRADDSEAIAKLCKIKNRPKDKPFSLALGSIGEAISKYLDILPPFGYRLLERFWPGPLTIIYYGLGEEKIGIRVPSHAIASEILRELNIAICLPSANISSEKEAVTATEVESIFKDKIDLIVDGGGCIYSKSSTVVDLTCKPFKVIREGVISEKDIARMFVKKRILFVCTGNTCRSPMAQFLLEKYLKQEIPYFKERYEIVSAGIAAIPGSRITNSVISVLQEKEGIDIDMFQAQRLDRYLALSSDFIFTMEESQSRHILDFEPKAEGKIIALKKFLPPDIEKDIPDPIGQKIEVYEDVYSLIKEAILELKDWL